MVAAYVVISPVVETEGGGGVDDWEISQIFIYSRLISKCYRAYCMHSECKQRVHLGYNTNSFIQGNNLYCIFKLFIAVELRRGVRVLSIIQLCRFGVREHLSLGRWRY